MYKHIDKSSALREYVCVSYLFNSNAHFANKYLFFAVLASLVWSNQNA